MPEQHLWSCDDQGNAYYLSSWDAGWKRLRARRGRQLRIKRIVASSWCIWVIAADQSPYLLVPFDGTTIRVTEIITQNERWNPLSGFSASNLTAKDPPEFVQDGRETYNWSTLPSTRWQWESADWEYLLEHSGDRAGWEYSSSFQPQEVFTSCYRLDSVVRRRRWQRVRRFLGHDRWLLCSVSQADLDPLKSDPRRSSGSNAVHVHKLVLGGENIPYQPLGFHVLWAVTKDGQVVCRTNIHRNNPEGSRWTQHHLLFTFDRTSNTHCPDDHQPFALDIHVNLNGQVFVLTDENQLFLRTGVSWKYPYGISWTEVVCNVPSSVPLRDHEHLVSVSAGARSIWLLSNTGRTWFNTISALVDTKAAATAVGGSLNLKSVKRRSFWWPMSGRLVCLAVSPFDQVFALDLHTNRLIYRSGITPETPGGQSWFALDLPILPTFDDELKVDTSGDQEGPLLPLCPPQEEVIQLIGRVLQLTNLSFDHTTDENIERLSVPEDYDASAMDQLSRQISPGIILSNKIRRLFTPKHRNQINNFFGSFRYLLDKDSSVEKNDSSSRLSEDRLLPKIGYPPARLMFVWAGAMNSPVELNIPSRWRIASLLTDRKNMIPYFSVDMDNSSPGWFQQIESSLTPSGSPCYLKELEFTKIFEEPAPWTETFTIEVLQPPFSYSKDRSKSLWVTKQAVITHFSSPSHFIEFSLTSLPNPSGLSPSEESIETTPSSLISNKLTTNDIVWTGFIDSLSSLLPRNAGIGRQKFSGNVPIRKPGEENLSEVPKRTFPLPSSPNSPCQLVTIFVHEEKVSSSTTESHIEEQTLYENEEGSCGILDERSTVVKSNVIPRWIMRFPSKAEASSWLAKVRSPTEVLPSTGRIWMVTEQAEVFWSIGTSFDGNLTWNKIGGHFARVESISLSGQGGGQVTWALGYNGTPWVLRDDWTDGCKTRLNYSSKQFPFNTPHFQTDIRQFRVYEFQSRRIIHGYSSSKAFNERSVMWCRDAQHREPCSLCDIHLPPHSGRVHWLGDWEVDFSPLAGCAPHYAPALLRKSRSISSCGNCDPELRSPSISPHRSPGTVTTEVTSSSVGSLEVVVTTTVNSPTVTVSPHPPSLPPPNTDFKDGGMYGGSDEGFVYATTPSCDAKGWIYLSRSSSCGHQGHYPRGGNGGVRHRRWIRSCAVCTEAPWQEVGPLKVRSLSMTRASGSSNDCIEVWAATEAGELVFRRDVTPSNPAGSVWIHHSTPRRLHYVAAAPVSSVLKLWAICADFGLLWQQESVLSDQRGSSDQLKWRCLGFSPTGSAWYRLAPVSGRILWALDVDGRLWVYLADQQASTDNKKSSEEERSVVNWIKVVAPRVSDISCSPDGKVWAVFSSRNAVAVRTGMSQKTPSGTGWLMTLEGIVSSVCLKGGTALS